MRLDVVLRYVGTVLILNAFLMLVSAMVSLFNGIDTGFFPLLLSFIITSILGAFPMIFVPKGHKLTSKEGYMVVITSWVTCCIVGMLPYLIWGGEFSVTNGLFESISGYTATGATILNDVEALPRGLLFWRSITLWIGGVGVVLFALVILPSAGKLKMTLSSVELSTLAKKDFQYNTRKTVRIILMVYGGITLTQTLALHIAGMNWFDSLCHSFACASTGGFSTKNAGIMYFDSIPIEIILMIFMVIGGIHMGLIYSTLIGKKRNIFTSEIVRFYILVMVVSGIFVSINLYSNGIFETLGESIRHGFFQVVSFNTTTGFASADNSSWPPLTILIMIYLSIQCATAGSTSGGIKADRVLLLLKSIKANLLKAQHPNAVIRIKMNGQVVEDSFVNSAVMLITFYIVCIFVSTLFISLWDYDILTSFTASIAALCSIGTGFGEISNTANMSDLPAILKLWISCMMLLGRLELFGFIHLFLIRSWK